MRYCSESMSITIGDISESSERNSEGTPCRLCMKKNDYYHNIFTSIVASQITVEDALYDLVDLKVAVGDGLPATLCAMCLEKVIEFNDFRNICHKSDAELRTFSCRNYFRSIGGEGAVHDNLRSSTQTNDCVHDAIVGTSEVVCSVQPNEIFIPVPDIQLPTANMLCHVKVENKESQREENNEILHGKAPDGIESDVIDPLGIDDMFHVKEESIDPLREENGEVLHGTAPDGIKSDAIDPLAMDDLSGMGTYISSSVKVDKSGDDEEEYDCTDWASNDLMPHASADQTSMASGGKEVDDEGRGVVLTDHNWKLIEAKKEPSPEEGDAAKPTFNENGEFIETLEMAVKSTMEAAGLPAPERSQMKTSSAPYLLALGDVRTDQSYGRFPPSTTVTLIQSKSGASHTEEGRNVIEKDSRKCSARIHGEGTSCLFPSDGQSYTKDIQASKISGVGTRKSFRGVGCYAPDTTDTLGCVESRVKRESGNGALIGEKEEISSYLIKNPGNGCNSNNSSYHCLSTRDGVNSKDEVSKRLQTNLGARNLDGDAELSDYSCEMCDKCFFRRDHLNEHMLRHTVEKPYSCDVCRKPFSEKSLLVIHCRTHTGERPYSCSICCKAFCQSSTLTAHKRTHSGERPYSCSICSSRFSQRGTLSKHMLRHTGEKPHLCDVCNKSFSRKCNFLVHYRTHTGERPFSCSNCSKSFSQRCLLTIHMRTHAMEKPYPCKVCSKSFIRRHELENHVRIHTGEKPYSCDLCNKSFPRKKYLVIHCRKHTGERTFSCNLCSKSYYQSSHLIQHKRTHVREKP